SDFNNSLLRTLDLTTGISDTLAAGGGINGPDGIVFTPNGDYILANFNNNQINRITPTGEVSSFSTLSSSPGSGYLINFEAGYLITGFGSQRIWQLSPDGTPSLWAGSNIPGSNDGMLSEATFLNPNGIAISPSGDTILVTEGSAQSGGRIRIITGVNTISSTLTDTRPEVGIQLFPNPTSDHLNVTLKLPQVMEITMSVYTNSGQKALLLDQLTVENGESQFNYAIPDTLASGQYNFVIEAGLLQQVLPFTIIR
ncbi:MAG: hypothetical protein AAFU67_10105, partial [Bacteroidota bacterium]